MQMSLKDLLLQLQLHAARTYQMSNAPLAQPALSLVSISTPSVICCSNAKCLMFLSQSALICSRAHAQSPFEGL
jgi:hypothetical protein